MKQNHANEILNEQIEKAQEMLSLNPDLMQLLKSLRDYKLPNHYVAGGAVAQIIWNHLSGFEMNFGIKDFDIIYYDENDISFEGEDIHQKNIAVLNPNFPIDLQVINEARTHLWYKEKFGIEMNPAKYTSTEDTIDNFFLRACSIGVRLSYTDKIEIYAPCGLGDIFAMRLRLNHKRIPRDLYEKKCSQFKAKWPNLMIIGWDES